VLLLLLLLLLLLCCAGGGGGGGVGGGGSGDGSSGGPTAVASAGDNGANANAADACTHAPPTITLFVLFFSFFLHNVKYFHTGVSRLAWTLSKAAYVQPSVWSRRHHLSIGY
jgi:hypothetical protein